MVLGTRGEQTPGVVHDNRFILTEAAGVITQSNKAQSGAQQG